mgnify:CR=1 FL=1
MQVLFETVYASESQKLAKAAAEAEAGSRQLLDKVVELGTNIQSSAQGMPRACLLTAFASMLLLPPQWRRSTARCSS